MGQVTRRGSALIGVLWTVALMSLMVATLAFDAHVEARIVSYYRSRSRADYLARSGLDVARLLMAKSSKLSPKDEKTAEDELDRWYDPARRLAEGLPVEITEALGTATLTVELVPEPGRRNVNKLTDKAASWEDWTRILEVGDVPEEYWDELIDSFFDWTDKDEDPRVEGAEDDYYQGLDPPYRARNGPLDTVGELLLVKGFSPPILSGGAMDIGVDDEEPIWISGIGDMLTTYGNGKVNVNAASKRVLMTLPGVDSLTADFILDERRAYEDEAGEERGAAFEDAGEFIEVVASISGDIDAGAQKRLRSLVTTKSRIYRLNAVATADGVERHVWGIVQGDGSHIRILRWREHE